MKMFDLVTETWNPVVGCNHNCVYCWARMLVETKLADTPRYRLGFNPQLVEKELEKRFKAGKFVFVSSMGDLFGDWVPQDWIKQVLLNIAIHEKTTFLLLTKNPSKMSEFKFSDNCVLGCTAETNRDYGVSHAPKPTDRLDALRKIQHNNKMVSVEPIMDFDLNRFAEALIAVKPSFVYVGYDNYLKRLTEPELAKTKQLGWILKQEGVEVRWKTLRESVQVLNVGFPKAV